MLKRDIKENLILKKNKKLKVKIIQLYYNILIIKYTKLAAKNY